MLFRVGRKRLCELLVWTRRWKGMGMEMEKKMD